MSSIKGITTFLTFVALFAIMYFVAVAIADPLLPTITAFDLGGMDSQVTGIHEVLVKWIVPVGLGTFLLWTVFFILREERQTVR
jgi:hypothetical protein